MVMLRVGASRGWPSVGLCGSMGPLERDENECDEDGLDAEVEVEAIEVRLRPRLVLVNAEMGGRVVALAAVGMCDEEIGEGAQLEG